MGKKSGIISKSAVEKILYRAGAKRVSDRAVMLLAEFITELGTDIGKKASEIAKHTGRRTIQEEDIELVSLKEELGDEIVDILINNRYDTAVEVLSAGVDKLKEIEAFDDAKAEEIFETIKSQFEEEE